MSGSFDAVIFDMDGVLFDSERISRMAWIQAGKEFDVADVEQTELCVIGRSFSDTCDFLRERYGPAFPAVEFRTRCSQLFHQYTDAHGMPLMQGAREILEYLAPRYVLALASSTRKVVITTELEQAGLAAFFRTVTSGDEVAHSKPAPDIYLKACQSLSLAPGRCLAVEDSPNGVRSAVAAGVPCVMVPDQIAPDAELRSMAYRVCDSLAQLTTFL